MSTTSGSHAEPGAPQKLRVWDLPLRVFHALLIASFAAAWMTGDSERWRDTHVLAGYGVLLLLGFRLVWGFAGTRHARFAAFAYGPRAVLRYLLAMARGRAPHFTGHNPAGSWAVWALLGLALATSASGLAVFNNVGGESLADLHAVLADAWLMLVALHVAAVLLSSALHRDNLLRAMISGNKRVMQHGPNEPKVPLRPLVALLLLALMLALWLGALPLPGLQRPAQPVADTAQGKHHD